MAAILDLEFAAHDDIPKAANKTRDGFHAQKTKPLEYRKVQLRKLYWGLKDNSDALLSACKKDLGRGAFEAGLELDWCMNDCIFACDKLESWAGDEKAPDTSLANTVLGPKIRKEPLGLVLIIGTYNFPLQLLLCPLIGAIAAGNAVVIKPSEHAPRVAAIVGKVVTASLDPSCYSVIQGAVPETTLLLEQKWDKIFYTGGATVGTIIAKKAAETLTPYTLELGGRNPAIVTKNANLRIAAKRLLWGKIYNAGQVCISQNYTLVEESVLEAFIGEMKDALVGFFPKGTRETDDFGRIVNLKQFQRIQRLLCETKGKTIFGGELAERDLYVPPTMILLDSADDPLLKEESFAPLLPILPFSSLDSAIMTANSIHATPLGFYPFGSSAEVDRMMSEIRSGGASINDSFIHGAIPTLAFGGVGDSGQGVYHGKASFDCFSHRRSFTYTPNWAEKLFEMRYPPYEGKLKTLRLVGGIQRANFDREGRVARHSILRRLTTLGAGSIARALVRYIVVLLAAIALRRYWGLLNVTARRTHRASVAFLPARSSSATTNA